MATRYVIVGGGLAAASAIEGIRELDAAGEIVLLTAEKELPYHRPPLSKGYLAGRDQVEAVRIHEPAWYRSHGVRVKLGQVAKSVHLKKRSVTVESGERESYDRLLVATGSRPRRINTPGIDTPGVLHLRTLADSSHLRSVLKPGARLVCVGGGFIGVEVACTARDLGAEGLLQGVHVHIAVDVGRYLLGDEARHGGAGGVAGAPGTAPGQSHQRIARI